MLFLVFGLTCTILHGAACHPDRQIETSDQICLCTGQWKAHGQLCTYLVKIDNLCDKRVCQVGMQMHPGWLPFSVLRYWWHLNCVCVANSQTFLGNRINPGQLAHATMARPASSGWKQLGSAPVCCLLYILGRHPQCPGCSWCWQPVQEERDACAVTLLSHCTPTAIARAQPLLLPTFSLWGTPHSFLMYFFPVTRDTLTTVGHRMDVKALAPGWLMCGCLPF